MINNIQNILLQAEEQLYQAQINQTDKDRLTIKLDASILLAHVLSKPRSYLLTWPDKLLSIGQIAMFHALIKKRCLGEPVAYITGQKEFFSLIFNVNKSTLIPRPETELLIETILARFKDKTEDKLTILDLGTGSGAIAISLAKSRPNWQITAVDNSHSALEIAKKNAKLHEINNINFVFSDWFSNVDSELKFDCIVANPPYISSDDPHLEQGDVKFEPRSALISQDNGLADIKLILNQAGLYLAPNGLLIFEHGYDQLSEIQKLINLTDSLGQYWGQPKSILDYAGLPRVILVQKRQV
ncbi:MAG: peptide chain release factor N(5)-glutamine methyltransferase [Gammaproteobacteria bacterium]|nr:peptide chain release factor N(5)-glutamine methyltransferase [Gammaproteobacteria bacterium]